MPLIRGVYRGVLFAGLWLSLPFVSAADPGRGEMLYENHCRGCHVSSVHDRSERRATSIDRVYFEVGRWSREQKLEWDETDVADVVDYLNETFYRFE